MTWGISKCYELTWCGRAAWLVSTVVQESAETLSSRYEAGFTACVAEVGRYFTSVDVVPQLSAAVLPHLVDHLAGCLRRRCTSPTTPTSVEAADEASVAHRRCGYDHRERQLSDRRQSHNDIDCSFLQPNSVSSVDPFCSVFRQKLNAIIILRQQQLLLTRLHIV